MSVPTLPLPPVTLPRLALVGTLASLVWSSVFIAGRSA